MNTRADHRYIRCLFGLSFLVLELLLLKEYAGNWTSIVALLFDNSSMAVFSLSLITLAVGSAVLGWAGYATELSLWVLTITYFLVCFWELYYSVPLVDFIRNLSSVVQGELLVYSGGFVLVLTVLGYLILDIIQVRNVKRELRRRLFRQTIAVCVCAFPWIVTYVITSNAVLAQRFGPGSTLDYACSVAFTFALLYNWRSDSPRLKHIPARNS